MLRPLAAALSLALLAPLAHASSWSLVSVVETPANTRDALPLRKGTPSSANINRFGFYSDLVFDQKTGAWYALADRGPGGGLIDYATRVERLSIPFNKTTGAIGQPVIQKTMLFTGEDGLVFNGLNPLLLNGDKSVLGASFDPEGLAIGNGGHFFVADEYGPSVYEFTSSGQFIRALTTPENLKAVDASAVYNYVDGRPTIVHGRQDNRGFEGLTFNKSGDKLYAVMQDPLVDEGSSNDGRRSRNVRVVEFDAVSGQSTAQFVYQLEEPHGHQRDQPRRRSLLGHQPGPQHRTERDHRPVGFRVPGARARQSWLGRRGDRNAAAQAHLPDQPDRRQQRAGRFHGRQRLLAGRRQRSAEGTGSRLAGRAHGPGLRPCPRRSRASPSARAWPTAAPWCCLAATTTSASPRPAPASSSMSA